MPQDPRPAEPPPTAGEAYADRLRRLGSPLWKRAVDVQRPYRWHVRSLRLGRTLDVGCGIGRHLASLPAGSVGVDHNPFSVATARAAGHEAYTVQELFADGGPARPGSFDALLASHLVEHLDPASAREVLRSYLPLLRPGGTVVLITPQERGYASDGTHVAFTDLAALDALCRDLGLEVRRAYSFPFPRWAGRVFTHNEFVTVAVRPA